MYRTFSGQCDSRKEASFGRMVLEQKQTRATAERRGVGSPGFVFRGCLPGAAPAARRRAPRALMRSGPVQPASSVKSSRIRSAPTAANPRTANSRAPQLSQALARSIACAAYGPANHDRRQASARAYRVVRSG